MNYCSKLVTLIIGFYLVTGCTNEEAISPYDEIYKQAAFSGISDSIRKSPQDPGLYFRRAVLLNKSNFPEPALADFEKAWSLKKDLDGSQEPH